MTKHRTLSCFLISFFSLLSLPAVTPASDILQQALKEDLAFYGLTDNAGVFCNRGYCWSAERRGTAMFYLAVKALAGNKKAETRLFQHIRNLLIPGNEPDCTGALSSRGHGQVVAALALVKSRPILWKKLKPKEQSKIVSLVKGCLVAAATTSSDHGDFGSGLDGCGNFGKTWNPNYREGFIGELIAAALFFDSTGTQAADILDTFDCKSFIDEAKRGGLPTVATLFQKTTRGISCSTGLPQIEQDISAAEIEMAVQNYTYMGNSLTDLVALYNAVADYTFSATVACSASQGSQSGGIVRGCAGLPNKGATGMLREFKSSDASGLRTSLSYSALGWMNSMVTTYMLGRFGYSVGSSLATFQSIGTTDLLYKAERGYNSLANGVNKYEDEAGLTFGFKYIRNLVERP